MALALEISIYSNRTLKHFIIEVCRQFKYTSTYGCSRPHMDQDYTYNTRYTTQAKFLPMKFGGWKFYMIKVESPKSKHPLKICTYMIISQHELESLKVLSKPVHSFMHWYIPLLILTAWHWISTATIKLNLKWFNACKIKKDCITWSTWYI